LMDFNNKKKWKNTRIDVPTIRYFENDQEIEKMMEADHQRELKK
jgi:hypothetical protein